MSEPLPLTRIVGLVTDLAEPHIDMGPLDREDLRTLLYELLEHRNNFPPRIEINIAGVPTP
jgi:hypothetical protein